MFRNVCEWSRFSSYRTVKQCASYNRNNLGKKTGEILANSPGTDEIPEVTQIDELETFVGKKKQNLAVDSSK